MKIHLKILIALILFANSTSLLKAQNIWIDHKKDAIILDLQNPFLKFSPFEFPTGYISLTGRFSINDRLTAVTELPFSISRFDFGFTGMENVIDFNLGNIYLGLDFATNDGVNVNEFSIRLPTSGFLTSGGTFSNLDRLEVFLDQSINVGFRSNYYFNNDGNVKFRLRGGPNILFSTEGFENEAFLDYAGQFILDVDAIYLKAGISGQFLITEQGPFNELSNHFLGFGIDFKGQNFTQGLNLKIPLDTDIQDILSAVLSLNFSYNF